MADTEISLIPMGFLTWPLEYYSQSFEHHMKSFNIDLQEQNDQIQSSPSYFPSKPLGSPHRAEQLGHLMSHWSCRSVTKLHSGPKAKRAFFCGRWSTASRSKKSFHVIGSVKSWEGNTETVTVFLSAPFPGATSLLFCLLYFFYPSSLEKSFLGSVPSHLLLLPQVFWILHKGSPNNQPNMVGNASEGRRCRKEVEKAQMMKRAKTKEM